MNTPPGVLFMLFTEVTEAAEEYIFVRSLITQAISIAREFSETGETEEERNTFRAMKTEFEELFEAVTSDFQSNLQRIRNTLRAVAVNRRQNQ